MQSEIVRCLDCFNCKIVGLIIPKPYRIVRCTEGVFDFLGEKDPYLIVERTCEYADVEEEEGI